MPMCATPKMMVKIISGNASNTPRGKTLEQVELQILN